MTAAQIATNRANAVASVRASLGLNNLPSTWTYAQRNAYNKALATYISTHPDQFASQDLINAEAVEKKQPGELEDASFDWGMFGAEAVKPAGDALQNVGKGVFTVANAMRWAIPVLAVLALFFFFEKNAARDSVIKRLAK
jgi:hypothetical protein